VIADSGAKAPRRIPQEPAAESPILRPLRSSKARYRSNAYPRRLDMSDRTERVEGKVKEIKGRVKRDAGRASGRPETETRGGGEELAGKAKNAVGKARSAVKKATR
jgi:uncharacterized protein YjbJ (UPF0337 family)